MGVVQSVPCQPTVDIGVTFAPLMAAKPERLRPAVPTATFWSCRDAFQIDHGQGHCSMIQILRV